jgi:hypothetical protein
MIDDGAPHPVELLRDRHGVYGIGASELFDFELRAARAGVELAITALAHSAASCARREAQQTN